MPIRARSEHKIWATCSWVVLGFAVLGCTPPPGPTGPQPSPTLPSSPPPTPVPPGPAPGGGGPSGGPTGGCDESYDSATAYASNPRQSTGVDPGHSTGPRATFVANRASASPRTFAVSGRETGGSEIHRGLLLNFDDRGQLRWGKSLSHCQLDEVESVAVWGDGSLAATTTYYHDGQLRTDLLKLSTSGEILWRHLLAADSCTALGCYHNVHSEVEVDHHDGSVVAAVRGTGDTLLLVRVSSSGSELQRKNITEADVGGAQLRLASLALYEGNIGRHSDVLVGLSRSAVLFTSNFDFKWNQATGGGQQVEVAMCQPDRYTLVSVGAEYMSNEHVVASYSKAGTPIFSFRVAGGTTAEHPAYGVVRGDIFNLGCNEQDTPELVLRKSDGGREFSRQVVALMLLTNGNVHQVYDATIAEPAYLAGSTGVGVGANALLLLSEGKFSMHQYDRVGWTRRTP